MASRQRAIRPQSNSLAPQAQPASGPRPRQLLALEPLPPLARSLAHRVRQVNRGLMTLLEQRVARFRVTAGAWLYLRVLWEEDGLTPTELSARTGLAAPTTATALRRMERAGLVTRRASRSDRRQAHIFLTRQGKALRGKLTPCSLEVMEIALAGFSPADLAQLRALLDRMARNVAAAEARPGPATSD